MAAYNGCEPIPTLDRAGQAVGARHFVLNLWFETLADAHSGSRLVPKAPSAADLASRLSRWRGKSPEPLARRTSHAPVCVLDAGSVV